MVQSSDCVGNIYRFYLGLSVYTILDEIKRFQVDAGTIAEANLDDTRSIFVRSRERSTTYRVKRSSDVAFFPCGAVCIWIEQLAITGERICLQCFAILHQ